MSSKRVSNEQTDATLKRPKISQQRTDLFEEDVKDYSDYKSVNDTIEIDTQRQEPKVDFVTRVPYDILCEIACYLDTKALDECINVSLTWRTVIARCPAFWRRMELEGTERTPVFYILPNVAHHIRDLKICMLQDSVAKIFQVMEMGHFSNLQSLDITLHPTELRELRYHGIRTRGHAPVHKCPIVVYSTLCRFLPYASTLTEIRLWLYDDPDVPSLSKILSICRNLEGLEYICKSTSALVDLRMPYTTSLTRVSLSPGRGGVISQKSLKGLLQCSPKIRWLFVDGCPYDALSIIQKFHLQLEYLSINNWPEPSLRLPLKPGSDNRDEYQGLRYMAMCGKHPSQTLLPFLEKNRNTIQELYLPGINRYIRLGDDEADNNGSDALQQDFPIMTNLTALSILSYTGTDYWEAVPKILNSCSKLDTLEIVDWHVNVDIPNHLVDAVTGIKIFSTLRLNAHLESLSMLRLLENYATKHSDKSPGVLELYGCNVWREKKSVLMRIRSLRSLKSLRVHDLWSHFRPRTVRKLFQALGYLPQLEYLYIGGDKVESINDDCLQFLSRSRSLKTIQMENVDSINRTEKIVMLRSRVPPIQLKLYV